jgi:hypothetical protein
MKPDRAAHAGSQRQGSKFRAPAGRGLVQTDLLSTIWYGSSSRQLVGLNDHRHGCGVLLKPAKGPCHPLAVIVHQGLSHGTCGIKAYQVANKAKFQRAMVLGAG